MARTFHTSLASDLQAYYGSTSQNIGYQPGLTHQIQGNDTIDLRHRALENIDDFHTLTQSHQKQNGYPADKVILTPEQLDALRRSEDPAWDGITPWNVDQIYGYKIEVHDA